jgi:hypothetical protein
MRLVRVKIDCVVALEGDLDRGIPWIEVNDLVSDGVRSLPGIQALLPGGRAELALVVADPKTKKIRAARLRDFRLEKRS